MEQVPTLLVEDEKLKNPEKKMANTPNPFFRTSTKQINIQQTEKRDAIPIIRELFPGHFPTIKTITITEFEIKSLTPSIKPKESSGYDEIISNILKSCASVMTLPLSYIKNHSL